MSATLWNALAWLVTREPVANWIIRRAQRTPYLHLPGYMDRWWLFNGTPPLAGGKGRRFEWLPSVRVHHIKRRDLGRDQHSHPWDARTIILKGYYVERRGGDVFLRMHGDTAAISAETFHEIRDVSRGGVWTLFISFKWKQTWTFRTPEGDVPWRKYLGFTEGDE